MFSWLKKKNRIAQNAVGLPRNLVELLVSDFCVLRKYSSDLPGRIITYLLDAEGQDVLSDLRKARGCGELLNLICCDQSLTIEKAGKTPRQQFFEKADVSDPGFILRLAQVYDTASISSQRHLDGAQYIPAWLEVFLLEATCFTPNRFPPKYINTALRADVMEQVLVAYDLEPDLLVRTAFIVHRDDWHHAIPTMCSIINGFTDSIARYPEIVREALSQKDYLPRIYAFELMDKLKAPVEPFVDVISEQAVSSSANVREAVWPLLKRLPDAFIEPLKCKLISGKSDERIQAARLMHDLFGEEVKEILQNQMDNDKSTKVKEAIESKLKINQNKSDDSTKPEYDLPVVEPVNSVAPLSDNLFRDFEGIAPGKLNAKQFKILQGITAGGGDYIECSKQRFKMTYNNRVENLISRMLDFIRLPDIQLIHFVRLLILLNEFHLDDQMKLHIYSFDVYLNAFSKSHGLRVGLRELAAVFTALGMKPEIVGWSRLVGDHYTFRMDADLTWPYYAEHMDTLEQLLGIQKLTIEIPSYDLSEARQSVFEIISMFPHIPHQLVQVLWDVALGESKTERPLAKKCLQIVPEKEKTLLEALKSSKQTARAIAAEWLGELKHSDAIPAIKTALAKEKQETAKISMMNTLETLGVPLDEFMGLEQLTQEASEGLKKGVPTSLAWFPFDMLPVVHWQENGIEVSPSIIKWWICKHCKLNDPEPGALLYRHCSLLKPEDREALGLYILESWIAQDTIPAHTRLEAEKLAKQQALAIAQYYPNRSQDSIYTMCLNGYLDACAGSAIKDKGILAVAAACGSVMSVHIIEKYIRRWYGLRAAQCKALVRMLGWIDEKSATQLLLTLASRFRTKGIQEEADICVKALAERKSWTTDELADRTIPTAGFDDGPELVLNYGNRQFTASLDREFELILRNQNGEMISSLPEPRKDDDEELVKAVKDRMSLVRKELKSVLKAQRERLYEAMCTQRTWQYEDWNEYLNQHPIVTHYCQNLVWTATDSNNKEQRFRPLDDGTLTTYADEEIKPEPDTLIRLAHSINTPEDERLLWFEHFRDYEVSPLLNQFTRPVYILPENLKEDSELSIFKGYMIDSFKLRNRAVSFGYTRGETQEKGYFFDYIKRMPGIGLEAVIHFTGTPLPEENVPVALCNLWFKKVPQNDFNPNSIYKESMGNVPEVLLSECWNDLNSIAAEGTGFDEEWEKKTGYVE